jgi:hypothetical protein
VSRPWLALVLVLFCLPLFIGLRSLDLETDEAIYSFAVDRILVDGEWLEPKSSPSDTAVFLEKPPLKFWIVAAPILAGLLPDDEFGLRFWDAALGAVAFLYIFAIGCLLAGPVCGGVALLLLFVHWALLFDHGLRTNSMESALFLSYCGGIYHLMAWARILDRRRVRHAVAFGLYFLLGFMTKFVAVIFLPGVCGAALLLFRTTREKLLADRSLWLRVAALTLALIAPWFIYAQIRFGSLVWHTMVAEHVYARFTTALNPEHIHPWNYYLITMTTEFTRTGAAWFVLPGMALLLGQAVRRRWFDGTLVFLWGTLPLIAISAGSSKLYHYAYPFVPPLALAAGYFVALAMMLAPAPLSKLLMRVEDLLSPTFARIAAGPRARAVGTFVIWSGAALVVGAVLFGQVKVGAGHIVLFRSSGMLRPLALIVLAGLVTRQSMRIAPLVVALTLVWWMPVAGYKDTFPLLLTERHPLRDATDCIRGVEAARDPAKPRGLYVDTDSSMWHPITYYFRRIEPWIVQEAPSPQNLYAHLQEPALMPSLVESKRLEGYVSAARAAGYGRIGMPPLISLREYELLLPGPYRVCSPEAALHDEP